MPQAVLQFFAPNRFSHYSQMHPILAQFRIGEQAMKIVEYELKRYRVRKQDLDILKKIAHAQAKGRQLTEDDVMGTSIPR